MPSTYPRLLADIGGTNARFGLQMAAGAPISHVRQLPVAPFAGPAEAAQAYLAALAADADVNRAGLPQPRWAALAVATAVGADRVVFTNSHWDFSRSAVQSALALDGLLVLNDFEALALSLPCLGADQLRGFGAPPQQPVGGVLAVVGPGTGLGVGAVVNTRQGWVALPGEGGHATLAPADDLDSAVLAVVRRQLPHVSAERLLSGIGLPLLHSALAQVRGEAAPALDTTAIVSLGQGQPGSASDPLCSATLDLFCAMLGSFAGNVALTVGARGGLYIGGGIVPRFADRFFASSFRQRFEAKGRFQPYLQAIATPLITDTLAALSGTALAITQAVSQR